MNTAEHIRLQEHHDFKANWKKWGPYLSERAWGTVREDYSENGDAWNYFPHEHARSRAYRWNEDGLLGISDRSQYLCFALCLWKGKDPILKERLFGLSGSESNHGEDVKEYYFYLENTPTHSYMKALYKYPQSAYPYEQLIEESRKRGLEDPEYELLNTGIFDEDRYFDIFMEYAKAGEDDILIRIKAVNRGPETAPLWMLPNLWFRNTWSWGYPEGPMDDVPGKPNLKIQQRKQDHTVVEINHPRLPERFFYLEGNPEIIFTENNTNTEKIFKTPNFYPYVKDAFHHYIIEGKEEAINPSKEGSKLAPVFRDHIEAGKEKTYCFRLSRGELTNPFEDFSAIFEQRITEKEEFYDSFLNPKLDEDEKNIQRQALAGMLWTKQLYYYDIVQWLKGDPVGPKPPERRAKGRNSSWENFTAFDVLSMPDSWEYPWFACWDLAFHCITFSLMDIDYAKRQMELMTREWYMHTSGEFPAYEWSFSDVNPPVHAWSSWRIYKIEGKMKGTYDREFLEGTFHKLLLNFTWWVNRKDAQGNNIFQGGFLGLDNISIFNRSEMLPENARIDQSDGTAWMGFYCVLMMRLSLELAKEDPIYQDSASKFFEHFLRIAYAMTAPRKHGLSLWDEQDGFFYDALAFPNGDSQLLKIRSLVGLLPLFAVETIEPQMLERMPVFHRRMEWFISKRPNISCNMDSIFQDGPNGTRMISFLTRTRLESLLSYMLDETEFLSDYGIRSVSKYHEKNPYVLNLDGKDYCIDYQPGESKSHMFGGNSNWRGPIWFPINFLIIESLQKYHHYYGDTLKVECPKGSGRYLNLWDVAKEISQRLIRLFLRNDEGKRPIYGNNEKFQNDPQWKDYLNFNEYFHGDTGVGLGASHQNGWTGLVAKLLQQCGGE
ncbi:MAG: glucosidase [Chlamydiales bacterium]